MSGRGIWIGAAAAALMFAAGFGIGARQPAGESERETARATSAAAGNATQEAAASKYALFLFEDASYQSAAEGQAMERVREYGAWARELAQSGRFVDGEKLADDGRFCRLEEGTLTTAGPQADVHRGALTGYFVIGASSLDEAMQVAKTCPHLKYGGTLEIRLLETS
jgi:hypothetical protein